MNKRINVSIRDSREQQDLAEFLRPELKGVQSRKPKQTRGLMLLSSRALLVDNPWDKVSTDAISSGAGVVKSTIFNHFVDKADLLAAVAHTFVDDIEAQTLSGRQGLAQELTSITENCREERNLVAELYRANQVGGEALVEPASRFSRVIGNVVAKEAVHIQDPAFLDSITQDITRRILDAAVTRQDTNIGFMAALVEGYRS